MYEPHDIRQVAMREQIKFHCVQCGGCCRNVRDSVMLAPYDAFRLTGHLRQAEAEITIEEVLTRYCEPKPLSRGYIIHVLKTVDNSGICCFLKNAKCSVYAARPRTCRLYPFSVGPGDTEHSLAWYLCTERKEHFSGGEVTAREWRRKALSRKEESAMLAEFDGMKRLGKLLRRIPDSALWQATKLSMLFSYLYYDLDAPFLQQYQRNINELERRLLALLP